MINDLNTIINTLETEKRKLHYKGFFLDDALVSIKYLKSIGIYSENRWENIVKTLIGIVYKVVKCKKMDVQTFGNLTHKKVLVAINFPVEDKRHSKILLDFVLNFPTKDDIVVFTNQKSIYEICKNGNLSCVHIIHALFNYNFEFLFKGYTYKESIILSNFKSYIDILPKYIEDTKVKLILTTQDFLRPDYCYAIIGKSYGLVTVTHQHGSIPDSEKSLYSFLTSDYMLVWGELSKAILMRSINPERLKVVGTTKFNLNSSNTGINTSRNGILITPTAEPFETQKIVIEKLLFELKAISNIAIKLHPMHDYKKWNTFIESIMVASEPFKKIQIIQGVKESIYYEYEVLININSTAYLEGLLAGISMIELDMHRELSTPVKNIAESYVTIENVGNEVLKRITNPDYNAGIIKKQNELLEQDLACTNLELEYRFINSLLSKI